MLFKSFNSRPLKTAQSMLKDKIIYDADFIFYTDADIIFYNSFSLEQLPRPNILSWGAEHAIQQILFNSGVMVMNVHGFDREIAEKVLVKFTKIGGACEQDAIREHLLNERGWKKDNDFINLPNSFNYKCYWGGPQSSQDLPAIIHFHGPKPDRCLDCLHSPPETYEKCCTVLGYLPLLNIAYTSDKAAFCKLISKRAEIYLNNSYTI